MGVYIYIYMYKYIYIFENTRFYFYLLQDYCMYTFSQPELKPFLKSPLKAWSIWDHTKNRFLQQNGIFHTPNPTRKEVNSRTPRDHPSDHLEIPDIPEIPMELG